MVKSSDMNYLATRHKLPRAFGPNAIRPDDTSHGADRLRKPLLRAGRPDSSRAASLELKPQPAFVTKMSGAEQAAKNSPAGNVLKGLGFTGCGKTLWRAMF